MSAGAGPVRDANPASTRTATRLKTVILLMVGVWMLEVLIARGPLRAYVLPPWRPIASDLLFGAAAFASVPLAQYARKYPRYPRRSAAPPSIIMTRALIIAAIAVAAYVVHAGLSDYQAVLSNSVHSILGQSWPVFSISSAALVLTLRQRLNGWDWLLVALDAGVSAIPGGRTVPGLILLAIFSRWIFFHPGRRSRQQLLGSLTILVAGVLVMSSLGFGRNSNSSYNDPASLASLGYNAGAPIFTHLEATVGIIGEAALVTHTIDPAGNGYTNPGVLVSGAFSFLPGHQPTVDDATIIPYHELGSYVGTARPGGTPNSFYLLGRNWFVVVGGFVYTLLLSMLAFSATCGDAWSVSRPLFLILSSTYMLGAYGVGVPEAITILSVVFTFVISKLALRSSGGSGRRVGHRVGVEVFR